YADDDAARYYRLFRAAGSSPTVELLTTFDRMSQRAYPGLKGVAKPATQLELTRAAQKLRQAVLAARARGDKTQLYFVFAGHGEVAGGRGYLHLEDTRIDGAFIEREIIEKIPADTKHVLLDSCNSFFVINPRKPGGRRWATPKDMALGFSARHPEVGLFLSTNSDEEVFEWSEIESGVFSHEVRSGLTGAADVNRDGMVTYSELAGFVAEANRGIVREGLRPQVFYSGPHGDQQASLFSARALSGRRLTLGREQSRVWVRDDSGERLVDLHKEPGEMTLSLPDSETELSVFVQTAAKPGQAPTVAEHRFASGTDAITLADAPAEPPRLAARGDQLFGGLFTMPYGPAAYATYLKTSREQPAPVYGVRDDDVLRMGNYLTALADVDRTQRNGAAVATGVLGLATAGIGVAGQFTREKMSPGLSIGFGVAGAAFASGGLYLALSDSPGEKARQAFDAELRAQRQNHALAFARTEERLQEVAKAEKSRRQGTFWVLQAVAITEAALGGIGLAVEDHKNGANYGLLFGAAALTSGMGFYILSMETPTERILRLYRDDPGLKLRAGVSALPSGGVGFGLSGTF
ncbi:MAG TPA: hypothetical protein VEQ59_15515, partial [Polyangiaceae bacterium]|nr:hypothetical protein [Polyangiaceae bacterium]